MSVTERISGSSIVQPELLTLTSQSSNATHHLNHLSSTNGLTTNNAIMFRDDDDDCYCDNTISESLLISGNVNHSHNNDHHHLSYHHHHHQSSLPNANHHHHPNSHLNQHNQRQSNVQLHRINESPNDNGTNNNNEGQLGGYDNFNSEKGPPDIIPSIGYQAGGGNGGEEGRGNMEKQFLAYGYSEDLDQSNGNNIVEYAELAFPGGGPLNAKLSSHQVIFPLPGGRLNQVTSSNNNINNLNNNNNNLNVTNNNNTTNQIVNHPERIEYAKIEFQKNSRVNIITSGSPKFESTV
ncbi:GATA zinc finger domain-containing protein 8-like [Panonychus citri]|nr:GATA zinc finger domain-containing protein 8-like [Panonychus citri]